MSGSKTILAIVVVFGGAQVHFAQTKTFDSPDNQLKALVIPVGNPGFENQESRIEIRKGSRVIRFRSFASDDGQHGRGVEKAGWTRNGQFFVFSTPSSGGHQPWNWATYFYSRATGRFFRLDDYVGPVTSSFALIGREGLKLRVTISARRLSESQ